MTHNTKQQHGEDIAIARLFPEARTLIDGEEIYGDLELPLPASPDRPYVILNMVTSVDGRVSAGGKSSGIGSRVDRTCMRVLRSKVDAVAVGAGSLRAEKMNLGLDRGDISQPLAVIVGGSGGIPLLQNLILGEQRLLVAVPRGVRLPANAEEIPATILRTPADEGRVDLAWLLRALRHEHEVQRLLVEGGPGLNRSLIGAGLLDELFITVAPKLVLGQEHAIISGSAAGSAAGTHADLSLLSAHQAGDELFLRYRVQNRG